MKVVAINGSPKGKNSNTSIMINALLKGIKSPQTEIFKIYLSEMNIEYCRGCYSCWFKSPGNCIIHDDMKDLINLMNDTNIFIFGSPLFFNNISGTLKVFFDRLTAAGGDPHKKGIDRQSGNVPCFIMMSNCGLPDRTQFEVLSLWIRKVSKMIGSKLIGEFYTTNGKVLSQPTDEQQDSRQKYLSFLEICGKQYIDNLELSEEQKVLINMNILDF
jgi:FMN-dependent NADH-azoreductase